MPLSQSFPIAGWFTKNINVFLTVLMAVLMSGLSYHRRPCRCPWSVLQPEECPQTMLPLGTLVLTWGIWATTHCQVDVLGPRYLWRPCLGRWSYCSPVARRHDHIFWKPMTRAPTDSNMQGCHISNNITADTQLRGKDVEGLYESLCPKSPFKKKVNSLKRNLLKRTLRKCGKDAEVSTLQLTATGRGVGAERLGSANWTF